MRCAIPSLSYRAAVSADLPFIIGLIDADSVGPSGENLGDPNGPDYEAALAAISADPNQALFVAELGGALVGTFQLTYIPGIMRRGMWRGLVEAVHVAPEHRNKGIGRQMMGFAVAQCREHGCEVCS